MSSEDVGIPAEGRSKRVRASFAPPVAMPGDDSKRPDLAEPAPPEAG